MHCDSARSLLAADSRLLLCAREWAVCCGVRRETVCVQMITSGMATCCVQCANGEHNDSAHDAWQVGWNYGKS